MAVLNSPGAFTLLAASLALAVYLRAVSADAQRSVEALMQGSAALVWPPTADFTGERIALLKRTRRIIESITPWVFRYSILVGARIIFYALFPVIPFEWENLIYWADVILLLAPAIGVSGMYYAHSRLKRDEILIRHDMERNFSRQTASAAT